MCSSDLPSLARSSGSAEGLDETAFDAMDADLRADRYAFSSWLTDQLFEGGGEPKVSQATKDWIQAKINGASTEAMLAGIQLFRETDFSEDLRAIVNMPSLIVHGSSDRLAPISATSERLAKALPNSVFKVYDDAPHGVFATHAKELGADLLELVKTPPNVTLPAAAM